LVQFVGEAGDPELALFELSAGTEGEEATELESSVSAFLSALPLVRSEANRALHRITSATQADIVLHTEGPRGARIALEKRERETAHLDTADPSPAPAWTCDARFPSKLRRVELGGREQRKTAEDEKRRHEVASAADIVREAKLPLALLADASLDPDSVLGRVGQGRRFRTIQKRVASWLKAR